MWLLWGEKGQFMGGLNPTLMGDENLRMNVVSAGAEKKGKMHISYDKGMLRDVVNMKGT